MNFQTYRSRGGRGRGGRGGSRGGYPNRYHGGKNGFGRHVTQQQTESFFSATYLDNLLALDCDEMSLRLSNRNIAEMVRGTHFDRHPKIAAKIFTAIHKLTQNQTISSICGKVFGGFLQGGFFQTPMKDYLETVVDQLTKDLNNIDAQMHFITVGKCIEHLLKSLPSYEKSIDVAFFESKVRDLEEEAEELENIRAGEEEFLKKISEICKVVRLARKQAGKKEAQIKAQVKEEKYNVALNRKKYYHEAQDNLDFEPPTSFRELSVAPNPNDLFYGGELYLRAIRNTYTDFEQYLDIQFRLLKEDFTSDLREALQCLLDEKTLQTKENKLLARIYKRVWIQSVEFNSFGIVFRISFNWKSRKGASWSRSKRLIFGSFVVLLDLQTQELIFAKVVERNDRQMDWTSKEFGYAEVLVSMIEVSENAQHLLTQRMIEYSKEQKMFTLLEANAYYEGYEPIASRLKSMDSEQIPFRKYLLKGETEVPKPKYLNPQNYDLVLNNTICEGEDITETWRISHEVNHTLDESQLLALKSGITKEISLIQGPPGTGKTFVGVEIVKNLLRNRDDLNRFDHFYRRAESPILIICYTNHALDQFLEHIIRAGKDYSKGIIRVGGRSKNPDLEKYSLQNKRINTRFDGTSRYTYGRLRGEIGSAEGNMRAQLTRHLLEDDEFSRLSQGHYGADLLDRTINDQEMDFVMFWLGLFDYQQITIDLEPNKKNEEEKQDSDHEELQDDDQQFVLDQRINDDDRQRMEEEQKKRQAKEEAENCKKTKLVNVYDDAFYNNCHTEEKCIQRGLSPAIESLDDQKAAEYIQQGIWELTIPQRWAIHNWLMAKSLVVNTEDLENYQKLLNERKDLLLMQDKELLKNARIVAMTTTGASKYAKLIDAIAPKVTIIEEAAEVPESHIVASLTKKTEHLILIGDHKQLRPKVNVYDLAKKFKLEISLFERLVNVGIQNERLLFQRRMRPEIAEYTRIIYGPSYQDHDDVKDYPNIKGISSDVLFWTHEEVEQKDENLNSYMNQHEADLTAALALYLIMNEYSPKQITILTFYTGQMFAIRKALDKFKLRNYGITVMTVDNYQGEENEIIILSLVRSNPHNKAGFLKEENRICVSLSRAKWGMYVIGNLKMLAKTVPLWKKVHDLAVEKGTISDYLTFSCRKHEKKAYVRKLQDFVSVPEGGCNEKCQERLECGHSCPRYCHPEGHDQYECLEPCTRIIEACGHPCDKICSEKCFCEVPVRRQLNCKSKHEMDMKCGENPDEIKCNEPCETVFECGHQCEKLCHQRCEPNKCKAMVDRKLPCGHIFTNARCWQPLEELECKELCGALLECGHICKGTCHECQQSKYHIPCGQKCGRQHFCQHSCQSVCTKYCTPCEKLCNNSCIHSNCPKKCGEVCVPCKHKCAWNCPHKKCTKLCGEMCDRGRCDKPCNKKLGCGHPCLGLCQESCPKLCRICQPDHESFQILFGNEDDAEARFYQLEDCPHIFEVSKLDEYMDSKSTEPEKVQFKCCPRCKTPIQRSFRYGNIIKATVEDINHVKRQMALRLKEHQKARAEARDCYDKLLSSCDLAAEYSKNTREKLYKPPDKLKQMSIEEVSTLINQTQNFEYWLMLKVTIEKNSTDSTLLSFSNQIDGQYWKKKSSSETWETLISALEVFEITYRIDQLLESETTVVPKEELKAIRWHIYQNCFEISKEQLAEYDKFVGKWRPTTREEQIKVYKALNLTQGHTYKCPNGHFYVIGDCGGANQVSQCPECHEQIGGTNHTLLDTNRHSGELDDSHYSAWSQEANLQANLRGGLEF